MNYEFVLRDLQFHSFCHIPADLSKRVDGLEYQALIRIATHSGHAISSPVMRHDEYFAL